MTERPTASRHIASRSCSGQSAVENRNVVESGAFEVIGSFPCRAFVLTGVAALRHPARKVNAGVYVPALGAPAQEGASGHLLHVVPQESTNGSLECVSRNSLRAPRRTTRPRARSTGNSDNDFSAPGNSLRRELVRRMTKTALMIGATGGVGREVARALARRGWQLRCLSRTPKPVSVSLPDNGVAWIKGDAMKAEDLANAARDVALIVHAANPPRYKNWRGLAMPMLRNSIEAASASNARLIFPGNLYNFGPDAAPLLSETAPQNPNTRKGRVRSEMEDMLRARATTGTRSLVVRAGDVFGGHGPSSNFSNVLI